MLEHFVLYKYRQLSLANVPLHPPTPTPRATTPPSHTDPASAPAPHRYAAAHAGLTPRAVLALLRRRARRPQPAANKRDAAQCRWPAAAFETAPTNGRAPAAWDTRRNAATHTVRADAAASRAAARHLHTLAQRRLHLAGFAQLGDDDKGPRHASARPPTASPRLATTAIHHRPALARHRPAASRRAPPPRPCGESA